MVEAKKEAKAAPATTAPAAPAKATVPKKAPKIKKVSGSNVVVKAPTDIARFCREARDVIQKKYPETKRITFEFSNNSAIIRRSAGRQNHQIKVTNFLGSGACSQIQ
jgi:hypothetical protein